LHRGRCEGGKDGDGKIFVTAVEQVVRIRTGETDEAAV
jgi:nitrogen regulatory protein P-II 1